MFQLDMVVTEKCNLACKYCYMHNNPIDMTEEIVDKTFELLPTILQSYSHNDCSIIYFGGEPLKNYNIIKYIHEKAKNNHFINSEVLISNLLCINNDIIDWITNENINVSWSFDGLWNENNRVLVDGSSSLDAYIKKIDDIKRLTVGCKVMISPASIPTMLDNVEFMYNTLGIKSLDYTIVRDDIWSEEDIKNFKEQTIKLADLYIDYIERDTDLNICLFSLPLLDMIVGKRQGKRPFGCFAGNSGIAIMPNGDMYPCPRFGTNKEFKYCSVYNPDFNNMLELNKTVYINPIEIEQCKKCKLYTYCNAGCTYSQLKNGSKPLESICKLYHIIYAESLRIFNTFKDKKDYRYLDRIVSQLNNIG